MLIDHLLGGENAGEVRRFRIGLGLFILCGVALFKSCSELKLSIWGREATATVVRAEPSKYNDDGQYLTFTFRDDAGTRHTVERTVHGLERIIESPQEVGVVYRRGLERQAVLAEERSMYWPTILGLFMVGGVVWFIFEWRAAKAGEL